MCQDTVVDTGNTVINKQPISLGVGRRKIAKSFNAKVDGDVIVTDWKSCFV